jgi:hypothetical protein
MHTKCNIMLDTGECDLATSRRRRGQYVGTMHALVEHIDVRHPSRAACAGSIVVVEPLSRQPRQSGRLAAWRDSYGRALRHDLLLGSDCSLGNGLWPHQPATSDRPSEQSPDRRCCPEIPTTRLQESWSHWVQRPSRSDRRPVPERRVGAPIVATSTRCHERHGRRAPPIAPISPTSWAARYRAEGACLGHGHPGRSARCRYMR